MVPKGGLTYPAVLVSFLGFFLIFLSILSFCVIALFTPFVLNGLSCDLDVTPKLLPLLPLERQHEW